MRERLTTLACALGALLVFATLFVRGGDLERQRAAPPSTVERGGNGLLAAMSWLRGEGFRTVSLRERFDTLPGRPDLPASGNLLIVSSPAATAFRLSEAAALQRWLRAGNTLLLLAAVCDRPGWALGGFVHSDLSVLTGLEFGLRAPAGRTTAGPRAEAADESSDERAAGRARRDDAGNDAPGFGSAELRQPLHSTLVAKRAHPYLAGVGSAVALSDYSPQIWDIKLPRGGFVLSLARQREHDEDVLWVRPVGAGTVIVSAFGSLFSNRALGLADNARLLGNIVSESVAPGGVVLFDDEHQGLAAAYDPAKFYRDRRLYATLAVLFTVWLVWVLGGTRLRLPASRAPAPREVELVNATGAFLARVLRPPAAARRMFENFFARLAARAHRAGGPPWDWLEHHPRLASADVAQLREWYADAYSDRRVPLLRLHNLIVRTERQLAA